MNNVLILGGGTAGTIAANKLSKLLPEDWSITVVDTDNTHLYQPGYLFLPFGQYKEKQVHKTRSTLLNKRANLVIGEVDKVIPEENKVLLMNGTVLPYDQLLIATGVSPRPDQTEGMLGEEWGKSVHEFYTFEGSKRLAGKLESWEGGKLVVHIVDMPIKCPVAPLEFTFLADAYFTKKGMRDKVDITYVTPLDKAFTKPIAAAAFGGILEEKKINLVPDFMIEQVDNENKMILAYDGTEVPFDLLVTVPLNMGADYVARSGLGNELNLVPVDKFTQQSKQYSNIFALGDANDIPASKAGSVAHFELDIFVENFMQHIAGKEMTHSFDGHANCFIETGKGKAMLIDFNYDYEPLTGSFPYQFGPLNLLKESRLNHFGKLGFRWMYWNMLLPGRPIPIPAKMSLKGKDTHLLGEK